MLYGVGLMMVLVSIVFVDGSILTTIAVAAIGLALMAIGGKDDAETDAERQGPDVA